MKTAQVHGDLIMQTTRSKIACKLVLIAAVASALGVPLLASGAITDISSEPVTQVSANPVKPNVMFILDDSGSMSWTHMPDDADDGGSSVPFRYGFYGLRSSQCNRVYYNPNIIYKLPVKADGTYYSAATFTAAWTNGIAGTGSVDLSTSFMAADQDPQLGTRIDATGSAAYYYKYTGAQTSDLQKNYNDPTTTFYKECASANGSLPGSTVFTKVTVGATSGPGATDERQNFANWYSYYRTRMLTMKSAVGTAFGRLDDRYRVGFTSISYTGTDTTNTKFQNILDFDAAQKTSWFSKLYGATPGGSTPLRTSLTKVGRIYANKLGAADPVQYSCQQNFAFLSTDGFWNTGEGSDVDGAPVGNQDGPGTERPFFDGKLNTTTTKTVTTDTTYVFGRNNCTGSRQNVMKTIKVTTRTVVKDSANGTIISDTSPFTTNISYTSCTTSAQTVPANTSVTDPSTVTSATLGGSENSLSDIAMYYYKTDLRPGTPTPLPARRAHCFRMAPGRMYAETTSTSARKIRPTGNT